MAAAARRAAKEPNTGSVIATAQVQNTAALIARGQTPGQDHAVNVRARTPFAGPITLVQVLIDQAYTCS